jgi:iron complex outermembrane receptor protein
MGDGGQKLTVSVWGATCSTRRMSIAATLEQPARRTDDQRVHRQYGNVLGDYGNFNMPRTFGLEGTVNF